jgi:hypothetical protein
MWSIIVELAGWPGRVGRARRARRADAGRSIQVTATEVPGSRIVYKRRNSPPPGRVDEVGDLERSGELQFGG